MRLIAFAASLGLFAAPVLAQEECAGDPEFNAIAQAAIDANGAPGAAVFAVRGDEVRVGAAGLRVVDGEDAATVCDLWHIGSNTKSMTALLVARLVEQGAVSWDTTVGEVLGPQFDDMNPGYADVNFRHLLSHQSGLRANLGRIDTLILRASQLDIKGVRALYAKMVLRVPPETAPGEGFGYSNAGYVVAGVMLETVTGESWETLMQREVFDPLGLDSAGFGAPGTAEAVDQPRGHRPGAFGSGLTAVEPGPGADNIPAMGPAGTVHVSMPDFARYMQAHLDGARGEDEGYLSAESWAVLHAPPFGGSYAMGVGVNAETGRMGHAGSNTMWMMEFSLRPAEDEAVAYAFNDGRARTVRDAGLEAMEAALEAMDD
jgi:CubicO group peptidase (beta-lactamase class C family)